MEISMHALSLSLLLCMAERFVFFWLFFYCSLVDEAKKEARFFCCNRALHQQQINLKKM